MNSKQQFVGFVNRNMKIHLPFDERTSHYEIWGGLVEFEWLKKYPQTLCWRNVKGLEVAIDQKLTTCKKCLQIAKNTYGN